MQKFTFKVTTTETYKGEITVEAETQEEALKKAEYENESNDLAGQKDTLSDITTTFDLQIPVHTVEELFNPDVESDDRGVILVVDLTKEQKSFLGLDQPSDNVNKYL